MMLQYQQQPAWSATDTDTLIAQQTNLICTMAMQMDLQQAAIELLQAQVEELCLQLAKLHERVSECVQRRS